MRPARFLPTFLLPLLVLGAGACGQGIDPSASAGPTTAAPTSVATPVDPTSPVDPTTSTSSTADTSPTPTTPAAEATDGDSLAARLTRSSKVRAEPNDSAKVVTTLGASTALGSKTTLLVVAQQDGWVQVQLPIRPNGSTGWINADDVELRSNPMAITVDKATHTLVLTHEDDVVLQAPVAIGSTQNPTPAGRYFVTDLVDTDAPDGPYGPYAFGLSGHSDALSEFGGGDGQLGIHGTNDPSSIGQSISHGCVRLPNEIVSKLVDLVPLGTPVTIT